LTLAHRKKKDNSLPLNSLYEVSMDEARSFAPLLIVVMLAFLVPLLISVLRRRLAIPIVVGEIVGGMVVGQSGFGWVLPDNNALNLLKELGFVLLMFLSGMEIDFRSLREPGSHQARQQSGWSPLSLAVLNFGATLLLAGAFAWGLKWIGATTDPWMMGLILSTTALGVVVPILKETGLSQTLFGQTILLATVIADFVTMFLISLLVAVMSSGLTAEILLVFLLFVAFFFAARFGSFLSRIDALQRVIGGTQPRDGSNQSSRGFLHFVDLCGARRKVGNRDHHRRLFGGSHRGAIAHA
jgi:Kef-type K+ transport system membrane component KefB